MTDAAVPDGAAIRKVGVDLLVEQAAVRRADAMATAPPAPAAVGKRLDALAPEDERGWVVSSTRMAGSAFKHRCVA